MVDIHPYLIDDNAIGKALVPIPVRDRAFQEEWLQELLFKHPSILPVDYIDEAFMPLVSIGREIANDYNPLPTEWPEHRVIVHNFRFDRTDTFSKLRKPFGKSASLFFPTL